jgi:hypothetical protein
MSSNLNCDDKTKILIKSLLKAQEDGRVSSTCFYKHHVHTPFELCDEILQKIERGPVSDYLVMFNLEFLYSVSKLIDFARDTVYYYTTDINKARAALQLFPKVKILDKEDDMGKLKFDVIVGNPPYQSEKGTGTQPLWPLFVQTAHTNLRPDGILAMITPNKWCGHTANVIKGNIRLYSDIFLGKLQFANIQECSKHFPGLGSYENCFSYFIVNNSGCEESIVRTLDNEYRVKSEYPYLPLKFLTDVTFGILEKIKTEKTFDFRQISTGFTNNGNGSIVISMAQRLHYDKLKIYLDDDKERKSTSKSTLTRTFYPDSTQEKIDSIFRSKLFGFIHMIYWNGDNFSTTFYNSLPYLSPDVLWTDEMIYDHFGLTKEERLHIDPSYKA